MQNKILTIIFIILYTAVAFVSTYHAIFFFGLSNPMWLAVILSIAFEVGQAVVLFTILTSEVKQGMSWVLMCILTAVQVLGNVFSSYKYMLLNNADQIEYFTKSVLFFVQSPNPEYNYVMISYITGAILPIVALCLTSIVAKMIKGDQVQGQVGGQAPGQVIENPVPEPIKEDNIQIESPIESPEEEEVFIPSN